MTPKSVQATAQAKAQADAETKKTLAEAARARAEAHKYDAETVAAKILSARAQIDLDRTEDRRAVELASDEAHHVYHFCESVKESSVAEAVKELSAWSRISLEDDEKPCAIELILQSPGGSVISGMAFYDFLQSLRRKGHRLTTRSRGWSASMAGILLQVGDVRVMDAESWLLIHRGSAGVGGAMNEIDDTVAWFKKIDERVLNIFYERSRVGAQPFTKSALRKRYERSDWWISSDEAFLHGFCDVIE